MSQLDGGSSAEVVVPEFFMVYAHGFGCQRVQVVVIYKLSVRERDNVLYGSTSFQGPSSIPP